MTILRDPLTGDAARVIDDKMQAKAITLGNMADVSINNSDAYTITTDGFLSITTTGIEHGLLYIKNTSSTHVLRIDSVRTCGTGVQKWRAYKNVSTGTLVSGASSAGGSNLNLISNKTGDFTAYKGGEGSTVTNGSGFEQWINNGGHSLEYFDGALILGQDDTLVLTIETAAAIDICSRIIAYFEKV